MKRTPLVRRTRINPVNRDRRAKRQAEGKVYGEYHRYVSEQPCILAFNPEGSQCFGDTVGHHVETVGHGGEDEGNEVSLCVQHHDEVHRLGIDTFQDRYGIDLDMEAANLWTRWRGLER